MSCAVLKRASGVFSKARRTIFTNPSGNAPALLVTCGTSEDGRLCLLNLEQLATIGITGDQSFGLDFMRYAAAELALNPWSRDVKISCVGVAGEVSTMNPARFTPAGDVDTVSRMIENAASRSDARRRFEEVFAELSTAARSA